MAGSSAPVIYWAERTTLSSAMPDHCPPCRLILTGDQAYHRHVVRKLDDGVGVVLGHTVVGEQSTGVD